MTKNVYSLLLNTYIHWTLRDIRNKADGRNVSLRIIINDLNYCYSLAQTFRNENDMALLDLACKFCRIGRWHGASFELKKIKTASTKILNDKWTA